MDVLVIDVGGSHVKFCASGESCRRRFKSGPGLTPQMMVDRVRKKADGWKYDVISLGVPAIVEGTGPRTEPGNLGDGWVGFDFEDAFGKPVRLVNDAVMQALGAYAGGRMLFLGLGTGLGSALVTEHVIVPLELGTLPFQGGKTMAERVGRKALEANGQAEWIRDVHRMVEVLRDAFVAEYLVLGGGNAKLVDPLPKRTRRGGNADAFKGGFRLWEEMVEPHARKPHRAWRVVR